MIYLYCILCIALELVIWLVPNIIGNAVAVSIVGVLLGVLAGSVADAAGRLELVELSARVLLALFGGLLVGEVGL